MWVKLLLSYLFIISTFAVTLQENQELYILKKEDHGNETRILVMVLESAGNKPRTGWIQYNPQNPEVQLFTSNVEGDNLAFLTTDLDEAYYVKTANNRVEFKEDSAAFNSLNKGWDDKLFLGLDRYVPISNSNVTQASTDLSSACPKHPQKKDGSPCAIRRAMNLSDKILTEIAIATHEINEELDSDISPALVASIIHHETDFKLFAENLHEKNKCLKGQCSDYAWGKGFAQLGKTDSKPYGLDWSQDPPQFSHCKNSGFADKRCFNEVDTYCAKNFNKSALKPYYCPKPALKAVARKIAKLLPKKADVHLKDGKGGLVEKDLLPLLYKNKETEIRNRVAAYNRRPARVLNSYAQFLQQNERGPEEFGEAWSTSRLGNSTPTRNIGYGMLTREFINRCYVWNVAGLCGDIPDESLFHQYELQLSQPHILSKVAKACGTTLEEVSPVTKKTKGLWSTIKGVVNSLDE